MKQLIKNSVKIAVVLGVISACNTPKVLTKTDYDEALPQFLKTITSEELKVHLYKYASDEFQGRRTGSAGQKIAVNYLRDFYIQKGIQSPKGVEHYFQTVPKDYIKVRHGDPLENDSENVLAFIEGSEFPDEIVVVSAHLDHLGLLDGEVCNGADDDGSGTVAILEMADAMQKAVKKGFKPKRSVLFLHVTGEEMGLWGSKYYSEHPVFPMENTVADLNIDMVGRIDSAHAASPNYVYPIGSEMLSDDLHTVLEEMNAKTVNLDLDYRFDDLNDPNRFYYRSDHYNFAKNNVPVIFFFNGVHEDYHKPTDTPDKIDYPLLAKRTQLVFAVLWEVANREERIKLK